MRGSRSRIFRMAATALFPRHLLSALPLGLATVSILGLRGVAGFYISPAIAFALGVAAVGTAVRRQHKGSEQMAIGDIGFALAIAACGAALIAVLATGHL